ncbi:uncharacterized protein LOC100906845 [Galendromus occidentalis]|uniref:Uncharacterized protein LOC100906845 n=1 Tax=Galendromus occidentalis TaxID=34638 RepID=A0AAJ6QQS3_9ACAR|nr:uncharacterized protein LOC100906845 [Galendromus occidentalis]
MPSRFLLYSRFIISEFAVQCVDCGKMLPGRFVIDPGSLLELPSTCAKCGLTCSENKQSFPKPITFADSFVPGSFVLAPIRRFVTPGVERYLWPAMVDFSTDENSKFCELGPDGIPTSYFVTFVTHGDKFYGGWFEEGLLHPINSPKTELIERTFEFQRALQKCHRKCESSLPSRLERFSFVVHVKNQIDKEVPHGADPGIDPETWEAQSRRELRLAREEFFGTDEESEDSNDPHVWPSAAFKIAYMLSRLQVLREKLTGGGEASADEGPDKSLRNTTEESIRSAFSSRRSSACEWRDNPFRELPKTQTTSGTAGPSSRKRSVNLSGQSSSQTAAKRSSCDGTECHIT